MVCEFVLYVIGKLVVYFKKNFDFGHKIRRILDKLLNFLIVKLQNLNFSYSNGFSTATIEYSPVCASVCVYVCVCVFLSVCQCVSVNTIPVTQKPMGQST